MEDKTTLKPDNTLSMSLEEKASKITDMTFVVSCLHPAIRRRVRKNIDSLMAYYSEVHKLYCDILDLTKETKVTDISLKIVLGSNKAKESIVQEALGVFQSLETMTQGDLNIVKERLTQTLYTQNFKQFLNGNRTTIVKDVNNIRNYKLDIDDEAASDKFIRRNRMTEINVEDALASLGSPIRSSIPQINKEFTTGGYIKNQLIDVVAAPSCLTGDTKIMTLDNGATTIEELFKQGATNFNVYCVDKQGNPQVGVAQCVRLMKHTNRLSKITFDDGFVVKCTHDHMFLTTEKGYIKAQDLVVGDSMMSLQRSDSITTRLPYSKFYRSAYEIIKTTFSKWKFTHRLSGFAKNGYRELNERVVHHKFLNEKDEAVNRLDNRFDSIELLTPSEHNTLHNIRAMKDPAKKEKFLNAGTATRYISGVSNKDVLQRWQNPEYRKFMASVTSRSGRKNCSKRNTETVQGIQRTKYNSAVKYVRCLIDDGVISSKAELTRDTYNAYREEYVYKKQKASMRTPLWKDSFISASLYEDALNYTNHKIVSIEEITLDEPVPVYDIINVDKFSNFAICGDNPHSGIFVHNCGKSLFMQNEAVSFIAQGYKVIYVALGDLNEIDFITRLCALIYNKSMSDSMLHVKEYYGNLIRDYKDRMDNLELLFIDPDTITIDELQDYLHRMDMIKPGNILMIDYDTNFKTTKAEDNIYEKGNEIFTIASAMSKKGKFDLVFIASQPKIAYYDKEIISQEAASESSRKSQIVDVMITIGKNPKSRCPIGCINLAKVRRGGQKTWFYYALDPTGKFIHIDRMTYMDAISREDFVPKNCDADLVQELYSDLYSPHTSKPAEETDSVF